MTSERPDTILILEDDMGVARLQQRRLERAGYAAIVASTAGEALEWIHQEQIDLLLLDNRLSATEDGLEFYVRLKHDGCDLPVIMVTGYSDDATIVRALRAGVRDYIFKSVEYLNYLPEACRRVLAQVHLQRELANSQARLAAVIQSALDAIITLDGDSRITTFNPAAEQILGCAAESALGSPVERFLPAGVPPRTAQEVPEGPVEIEGRRADGRTVALEATKSTSQIPGELVSTIILRDVTERKRAERELRESQEKLRLMADALPVLIAYVDTECRYQFNNAAYEGWFGVTAARCRGSHMRELLGVEVYESLRGRIEAALRGEPQTFETIFPSQRSGPRDVFIHYAPDRDAQSRVRGFYALVMDLTDLKRAEEELRKTARQREQALADLQVRTEELKATTQQLWQAAQLAGVGELAASIAHELNNPLGTVSLRIEGVLAKTPADDPRRRPLEVIDQEVTRMARLVSNLLQFSRLGRDQVSTVDVCEEVTKTIELTEHHMRKRGIGVETRCNREVPQILADRQHLRQVLLNLMTNAADAMPGGGRLTLSVRNGELPGTVPAVVIEVTDSGVGIPAEHIHHVLEPFFTTKEDGKGTGLGLAICRRIVQQHNGTLEIESTVGVGTTVRITLPVRSGAGNDVSQLGSAAEPAGWRPTSPVRP